jgi:phosphate transport system protein
MERHFHQELKELKEDLLKMSSLVEAAIHSAVSALVSRDSHLAEKTIKGDENINTREISIEKKCLELLALQQPMAADLRFLASALYIIKDLERMGDQAVNIAERALILNQEPPVKPFIDLPKMATLVESMVKDSLDAFVNRDVMKARNVCERDDQVDNYNEKIFHELLSIMIKDQTTISRAVYLILIGRSLERIADHATNIAEDVIYMVEGRVIKHHAEEKGTMQDR